MYKQEITQRHRTAFLIAIDQSQSMLEKVCLNGQEMTKAQAVAEITDYLLNELILRAQRDDEVRNYYDIAVLGYSDNEVYSIIAPERTFIPVSELPAYRLKRKKVIRDRRLPNGRLYQYDEYRDIWITPKSYGNTPMYEAMLLIRDTVAEWCRNPQNRDSFPPIIFNITDGVYSDCNEEELLVVAEQIRGLSTSDGNALLINVHLAPSMCGHSIIFPSEEEINRENRNMSLLAECSSIMPEAFNELIRSQRGDEAKPPFRAMSYNASITELIAMLNIGSRSVTNIL